MAIHLARSIRLNSPNQTLAVITDRSEMAMKPWFDVVVPMNPEHGTGMADQKLDLYANSPFRETMYIDADSLVVRDLSFLWTLFKGCDMSAIGFEMRSGSWAGMDVPTTCAKLAIPYVVQLNGGVYYFLKGDLAGRIRTARALIARYDEIGIARLRGAINDEPLISLAMAMCHQHPVDDRGLGMRTRIGQSGAFRDGYSPGTLPVYQTWQSRRTGGQHFGGRDTKRVLLPQGKEKAGPARETRLSRRAASKWVDLTWSTFHAVLVYRKRLKRRIAAL